MDSALKEAKPSAPAAAGRSKRSAIAVPIIVSGADKDGQSFREDSRTLVITRRGMMIETIHPLRLGMEVTVENPAVGRKSTGRIVWCGSERSVGQPSEIGIYLPDAEGLCGTEPAPNETEEAPVKADSAGTSRRRSEPVAGSITERLQSDADVALSGALERAEQTARLLEDTTVAALQVRVQKGAQELVENTAAQLRQLAQENLNLVSEQLAERQRQLTSEMSEALHHTFDELAEASSARLRRLSDDNLDIISARLATQQRLLISDTAQAFRQKIGEILVMLEKVSGENS